MAEDSDNALLPRIGGGGVPAPVLVNPLAAQNAGIQSAQGLWGIREKQAQEAIGSILQQATDDKGNVDYPKAQLLAKQAGPVVQMGLMSALKDTSGLRGAQITQSGALDDLVTTLSASAISDPSDANMASIRARAKASGAPDSMVAEIDRIAAIPDPAQRKVAAWQHLSGKMGPGYSLAAGGYPTPVATTFGGTTAPVTITPSSPYGPGGMAVGGGVAHTQDPNTYYSAQPAITMYDASGQVTTDPTKAVRSVPHDIPRGPAMGAPPPGSVGGPQGGGGPPAATPAPGALPPGAPPPLPGQRLVNGKFVTPGAATPPASTPPAATGGTTAAPAASAQSPAAKPLPPASGLKYNLNSQGAPGGTILGYLPNGNPVLAGPSETHVGITGWNPDGTPIRGQATATTTPAPAVPAQSPAAKPPAPPTPTGGGVVTGLPTGTEDLLKKDIDASTAARMTMGDQQKRLIAGNSALEALKLADTGPSTGFFAKAYAFFKAQGITTVPQGQMSDTDYRQLLQKNLLRFAQSSGTRAGTDLGLETKIHENANVDDMLAGANRHVLIQDLGVLKRDIAQTQEMPEPGGGAVVKHLGSFSANTAPEAFMWNHYTDAERAAIKKDYADKGKLQQLEDSVHLAIKRGAIPPPPPRSAPQKQSFVAPPGPAPNLLQMTG